ncbi:hypothetical protein LXL04_035034 [Taraxacum kok-saghyz]
MADLKASNSIGGDGGVGTAHVRRSIDGSSFVGIAVEFRSVELELLLQVQYKAAPGLLEEEEEDDENHFERYRNWVLLIEFEKEDDDDEKKKFLSEYVSVKTGPFFGGCRFTSGGNGHFKFVSWCDALALASGSFLCANPVIAPHVLTSTTNQKTKQNVRKFNFANGVARPMEFAAGFLHTITFASEYVHKEKLGTIGHSVGGILIFSTINMHPKLFRAVILNTAGVWSISSSVEVYRYGMQSTDILILKK